MTLIQKHLLREYGEEILVNHLPEMEFALDSDLDKGARLAGYQSARHMRSAFFGKPLRVLVNALEGKPEDRSWEQEAARIYNESRRTD